ncbi:MAG: beta-phosphoglucomutase [Desulfobulbaceae bacterium BRH_c16a]|nr:MAG: beta-phosphoglucomutase [Desulfobulbaceae bacterium BRH_c16a]
MTDSLNSPWSIMKIYLDTLEACIMDMDGVVTDTARLHARAWKQMFDDFLAEQTGRTIELFDVIDDYRNYVDGKPRYDGVASFLEARGISLPHGDADDPPENETVCGLGNRKNVYFHTLLENEGVQAFESTIAFIRKGRAAGLRFALISASRNARKVLEAAGLNDLFQVVVDGQTAAEMNLAGKPAPDIFLEAADRLDADVNRTVIVEDAQAGVQAGKAGGFAKVIGIDRHDRREALKNSGADVVVNDLGELTLDTGPAPVEIPELLSAMSEAGNIFKRLQKDLPALFLDYDGTLTPIVDDPAKAGLDEKTREILRKIAGHMFVAVISGRGFEDVRQMVGIDELTYAGSHGFEISGGSGYFDRDKRKQQYLSVLEKADRELRSATSEMQSIRIERKPYAVAIHYRGADERTVADVEELADTLAARFTELRKSSGKKIFELHPAVDWHKGKAVQAMLDLFHVDCSQITPLYIGDDTTDEDAFRSIGDRGITILVSDRPRPTSARFILRDSSEVTTFLEKLAELAERETTKGIWSLTYDGFDPKNEKLREALCTLGNGSFASRGASPQATAGRVHYPGTYLAGCYNRLQSSVAGHAIENESLVNLPNWLPLSFRLEDGPWLDPHSAHPAEYRQELDMASGILLRTLRLVDEKEREIHLTERRFVNMAMPHLAGLETEITVKNWSGPLVIRSALDGRVANTLVVRYRELNNDHLDIVTRGSSDDGEIIWLQAETRQSHIRIAEAGRTRFFQDDEPVVAADRRLVQESGYIGLEVTVPVKAGERLRVEKIVAIYNSRDRAISESLDEARLRVAQAPGFGKLLKDHQRAWRHLWHRCGFELQVASPRISQILNLHIFHLLQTVSVHSIDLDAGIPPRGLHGEAYRGLIMWDELFVFPFLNLRLPELTRALLKYRYRRLPQAKFAATSAGFQGAMFPWQSGSNGREEAQTLHLNPQSGRWVPDDTQLQRHIGIAVAYNVWLYYQVTGDRDFMSFYGAELMIETARFWAGLTRYNDSLDRYEITGVMGPDEFHTGYPGAAEPGLANNAYTNVMAAWLFCRALEVLEIVPEERRQPMREDLSLDDRELELWQDISRKMRIVFHDDGIISQFEGYDRLQEFDWENYKSKYNNIHRLDRILEAEGDSPNRYKLSKQADVLMLFYLLSAEELGQLFKRLGYPFEHDTIPKNIDYYLKRTSHGSTLSRVVHAWVLARSRREQSWHLFCDALKSDVSDVQGGTTHEGIHLGAMAGTLDLMQRCYTGLETKEDALWFNPALPREVESMVFSILYRQHWLRVTIKKESIAVTSLGESCAPITVGLRGNRYELQPGRTIEMRLKH